MLDNSPKVPEDIVELVNPALNLADLALALGYQLFLELELVLADLRGEGLRLGLDLFQFDRGAGLVVAAGC